MAVVWNMVDTWKTGKNRKKGEKKATCNWNLRMIFSTKVLLNKTNVMQEKSVRQKKRQNSGMLRGLGCFLGIKWAVAVPIFTIFNIFPLQTYFYAKSHLLSMLKSKKSDRWRKKCDQSTPALNLMLKFVTTHVFVFFPKEENQCGRITRNIK